MSRVSISHRSEARESGRKCVCLTVSYIARLSKSEEKNPGEALFGFVTTVTSKEITL